jgi:hypothetical protein
MLGSKLPQFMTDMRVFIKSVEDVKLDLTEMDPLHGDLSGLHNYLNKLLKKINVYVTPLSPLPVFNKYNFGEFSRIESNELINRDLIYNPPHIGAKIKEFSGDTTLSQNSTLNDIINNPALLFDDYAEIFKMKNYAPPSKIKREREVSGSDTSQVIDKSQVISRPVTRVKREYFDKKSFVHDIEIKSNMYLNDLTASEQTYDIKNVNDFKGIKFYYKNPEYYNGDSGLYNLHKGDSVYFIADDMKLYYMNQDDILEHANYLNRFQYWKHKTPK